MKSNDPWTDNPSRAHNKRLTSEARKAVRVFRHDGGRIARKRKKYVHSKERAAYRDLLASIYQIFAEEEDAK